MSKATATMEQTAGRPYRISVEQYRRMGENGIFPPGVRVELLDGEILEMNPIGSRHAECVSRLMRAFSPLWGRAVLRAQSPVPLDETSEPEPDFALVRERDAGYADAHPGPSETLLLIEVSDATLAFDRERKGPRYAAAGVPEYWIANLVDDTLEIHRRPEGDLWSESRILHRGDSVAPLAFPDLTLTVDSILPPPAKC